MRGLRQELIVTAPLASTLDGYCESPKDLAWPHGLVLTASVATPQPHPWDDRGLLLGWSKSELLGVCVDN